MEGVDRMNGDGRAPPPSASWAKNTIMTECTREIGHLQSMYLLSSLWVKCGPFQREGMGLLKFQAMPSFRDVTHDGIFCTFSNR